MLVAAAAAVHAACRFVVVGRRRPGLRARLQERIRRTGAPVELVGARDDVAQLLRAADVFVLPSALGGPGARRPGGDGRGRAVVASDVGGLRDLVAGAGPLVAAGDAEGLARAVDTLLADPGLRAQAARAGREAARGAAGRSVGCTGVGAPVRRDRAVAGGPLPDLRAPMT